MMSLNDAQVMQALKGTSTFRQVKSGDFVISLRSFEGGIEFSAYSGCVSPAYTVLEASQRIIHHYYRYLLKCRPFVAALQSTTDSLRDGKAITFSQFGAIRLPIPAPQDQIQIANFLDYETAKIDALIEKQQQLIALLKEKRQAVISHAVTKGLNPDVPMRDSGVEWLGEVPSHWNVDKLYHLTSRIGDGLHGTPGYQEGTGLYFVNGNNLKDGRIVIGESAKEVPSSEYQRHFIEMSCATVLLSINGTIGNVAIYANEPVILGKSAAYISCLDKLEPRFLQIFLQSCNAHRYYELVSTGTTISNLSLDSIRQLKIGLPDLDEQEAIIKICKIQSEKYESLIAVAYAISEKIQERRSALISAAVTGKIDVRGWKPPESETEVETETA